MLKKGRSKYPYLMKLMRKLTMLALINGFYFSFDYINTKFNISADLLSRLQVEKFKKLNPLADQQPTQCPEPELLLWKKNERHVSVSELLIESVSSSTQRTYQTGFQAFMTFLLLSGIFSIAMSYLY